MAVFKIELPEEVIKLAVDALAELPFKVSFRAIGIIEQQVQLALQKEQATLPPSDTKPVIPVGPINRGIEADEELQNWPE